MQALHHWESWLLRAALLATAGVQVGRHREHRRGRGQGFVVSLLPLLVQRLMLDRYGWLAAVLVAACMLAFVAALWFSGRAVPGLPTD